MRRLNDPAHSYQQNRTLRFAPKNPYDFIVYQYPNYFAFELKSTQGKALTFWRDDLPDNGSYMIHKHQIEGLRKDAQYPGAICGFILNFRDTNHTYFLHIQDFDRMIQSLQKKSFHEQDLLHHAPVLIQQRLKRTTYAYDVSGLIHHLQQNYNE